MIEQQCASCGAQWMFDPAFEEPNVCMVCGEPLCDHCYDASPYCPHCEPGQVMEMQAGNFAELDETGTHPWNCRCQWCEPYEPPLT